MSDTPRTNLEAFFPHESMYQVCDADFARQLERELQEANKRIKRLEDALRRIANQDYRGNRSTESQIAAEALKEAKP